jgi:hypothetical protein
LQNLEKVDLLLIDVPGYEFHILSGAAELINRSPGITMVIMFDHEATAKNSNIQTGIEKLALSGFHFYGYDPQKKSVYPLKAKAADIIEKDKLVLIVTKKDI